MGNISKILFRAGRSNFCRSIYRFQPATVQSLEAESLYRRENNQCPDFISSSENLRLNLFTEEEITNVPI